MRTILRDILITLLLVAVIFGGLQITFDRYVVDGSSMNPTLHDGQRLLINKLVYNFHEPQRGDVIIFSTPDRGQKHYIKRIIGLPGESVEIKDGVVYIHQPGGSVFALDEPYVTQPATQDFTGDIILENEYFFLGDNRNNSEDSRSGWRLSREDIAGNAWLSIWPPSQWGVVNNYPLQEQIENAAMASTP